MTQLHSSRLWGFERLQIPECLDQILDHEFANDISLYLQGQEENLHCKAQQALQVFCTMFGALTNWRKKLGFWVGPIPD
jgi:hypothetical protein